jgi:hypothetical protein
MSVAEHEDILVLNNDGDYLELHEGDRITLIDCDGYACSGTIYLIDSFDITLVGEGGEEIEVRIDSIEDWENYEKRK